MNKKVIVMQRGQNVNKKLFFYSFLFLASFSFAQIKIEGKYYVDDNPKWAAEAAVITSFNFTNNGFFNKEISGEFGTYQYGRGQYKFTDNKLILNYNRTEPLKISSHISKIWTNNKDFVNLHIKVFDFDSIPLPYVSIIYRDTLSKSGYSGVEANKKGLAILNLKRERKHLQLKISNVGFRQYEFSIDKNYNYNISVFLQKDGYGLPILNQVDTLEIVKKRSKYFTVKNKNGSTTKWIKRED